MTIIVTGGAGFIGSNFIYYQLEHHPVGLYRRTKEIWRAAKR